MNDAFCHRIAQVFYFVSIIMFMSDFSSRNGLEIMQNILDDTIRDKSCKRFVEYSRTILKCFDNVLSDKIPTVIIHIIYTLFNSTLV